MVSPPSPLILPLLVLLCTSQVVCLDIDLTCEGCFCAATEEYPCPTDWAPQTTFSEEMIADFRSKKLISPPLSLSCNPYKDSACTTTPPQTEDSENAVCAFKYSGDPSCSTYEAITYPTQAAADADGEFPLFVGTQHRPNTF